jgi:hypothetical protein
VSSINFVCRVFSWRQCWRTNFKFQVPKTSSSIETNDC